MRPVIRSRSRRLDLNREESRTACEAATASASTRSFMGSPEWPLIQRKATRRRRLGRPRRAAPTGRGWRPACVDEVVQPRAKPPLPPAVAEAVDDVRRVADNDERADERGDGLEGGADLHALVGAHQLTDRRRTSSRSSAQAQPPGPGLPAHAPSVNTSRAPGGAVMSDGRGRRCPRAQVSSPGRASPGSARGPGRRRPGRASPSSPRR